jgi:uncharacterized YccA/Bax inhibitor family protein
MMRTANPALGESTFTSVPRLGVGAEPMTIGGTVQKTMVLLALVVATASYTWHLAAQGDPSVRVWLLAGVIGGLVVAIVTVVKKTWAPVTAPVYALLEGLALGGISAFFNQQYPGIVVNAVALTFGTLFCLLLAYQSGWIRATENFKLGIVAATGAILLFYFAAFALSFFGVSVPLIHSTGPWGIAFSAVVVVIAALNLVLDFDFIEHGAERRAPKYMEWYAGFGLLVTLIWLYLEILRLLAKLQDRRR